MADASRWSLSDQMGILSARGSLMESLTRGCSGGSLIESWGWLRVAEPSVRLRWNPTSWIEAYIFLGFCSGKWALWRKEATWSRGLPDRFCKLVNRGNYVGPLAR